MKRFWRWIISSHMKLHIILLSSMLPLDQEPLREICCCVIVPFDFKF